MRRTLLLCATFAVACSPSDNAASGDAAKTASMAPPPPPAITLADVAGVWEGTVTVAGNDTVVATQLLTATADTSGWSMTIANAKTPTKTQVVRPTRVVAAGDSIVVESGPYDSILRAGQKVTTLSIFRLRDGKLLGMTHAMYPNEMVMLTSVATRKPPM